MHNHTFAAVAVSAGGGAGAGVLAELAGLNPAVWVAATFGSIYVYLHHADTPRNRLFNILLSIFFGVGGGDAAAGYVREIYHVHSGLLAPVLALLIAMAWPWFFEKFLSKKDEK